MEVDGLLSVKREQSVEEHANRYNFNKMLEWMKTYGARFSNVEI